MLFTCIVLTMYPAGNISQRTSLPPLSCLEEEADCGLFPARVWSVESEASRATLAHHNAGNPVRARETSCCGEGRGGDRLCGCIAARPTEGGCGCGGAAGNVGSGVGTRSSKLASRARAEAECVLGGCSPGPRLAQRTRLSVRAASPAQDAAASVSGHGHRCSCTRRPPNTQ